MSPKDGEQLLHPVKVGNGQLLMRKSLGPRLPGAGERPPASRVGGGMDSARARATPQPVRGLTRGGPPPLSAWGAGAGLGGLWGS